MPATLTLPKKAIFNIEDLPTTYEIVNRSASQWRQKNPRPGEQPKTINSSKIMDLSLRSRWNAGKGIGNVDIMYVPGADTIFVNDYIDEDGKLQPGLKTQYPNGELNKEQYRRACQAGICFVDGYLFADTWGGKNNPLLLQYLHLHQFNIASPNYVMQRDMMGMFLFKPLVPEAKAEVNLSVFDYLDKATSLLASVRSGKEYDTAKLNALLGVFSIGAELGPNANGQKMELLVPFATGKPKMFVEEVEKQTNQVRMDIATAQTLGILAITSKDVKMTVTGQPEASILSFKSKDMNDEARAQALIYHFLGGSKGKLEYSLLRAEVENKKMLALSQ